jgi:hypothetical protein
MPYASDTSPLWSVLNDDLLVRRDHLRLGDRYVSIISLKELPDRTEPGILVPLLSLNRERYLTYYRVDIPRAGAELAALRAKATLAAGLKLENFLVKSDRTDPRANAVEKQTDAAMERMISSTQRIFGTTLQLVLYESSPSALGKPCRRRWVSCRGRTASAATGRRISCGRVCRFSRARPR